MLVQTIGETLAAALFLSAINPLLWHQIWVHWSYQKRTASFIVSMLANSIPITIIYYQFMIPFLREQGLGGSDLHVYSVSGWGAVLAALACLISRTLSRVPAGIQSVSNAVQPRAKAAQKAIVEKTKDLAIKSERFDVSKYPDEMFEKALAELDSNECHRATMAKAEVLANGDDARKRSLYLSMRVESLSKDIATRGYD